MREDLRAALKSAPDIARAISRVVLGRGSPRDLGLIRDGLAVDTDPNAAEPVPFRRIVNDRDYKESWMEGLDVFHNPWATYPLNLSMLPGSAHHRFRENGQIESLCPAWQPLSSVTLITVEGGDDV